MEERGGGEGGGGGGREIIREGRGEGVWKKKQTS